MTEQYFTSINFEVYNSAWVDITADVKSDPRPKWNRGIMSNKTWDRVGHPGILTFTLKNDASNLGGKLGYYSPGHTNCWAGWSTGLKVRLSFTFEGIQYFKYYGRIKPDGIRVEPGIYGARTVDVTCGDWMWIAGEHELKTTTYAANQKIGDVVNSVNNNMPISPLVSQIATGVETFPTVFDMTTSKTTALAEYNKAAMSEWSYIYTRGDRGATYGAEQLTDGSLETWTDASTLTYWTKVGTLARWTANIYDGAFSAKETLVGDYCYQAISGLKVGMQYLISGWISGPGVGGGVFAIYNAGFGTVRYAKYVAPGTSIYWQEIYTAVGDEVNALWGVTIANDTVYFDAFSIKPLIGGEVLVVENQTTRTSAVAAPKLSLPLAECGRILKEDGLYLLKEDGYKLVWNDTQNAILSGVMSNVDVGYGRTQANRVISTAYPRRVDAAATTVLWSLQKSFKVNNGETIVDYRGQYRDPNNLATKISGISMAALVPGTDYTATANEDGTGADLTANLTVTPTFGSEAVYFRLVATADLWVQILQCKGKGVYTDTNFQSVINNTLSQTTHGVIPVTLDFKYQASVTKARSFAAYVLGKEAWPRSSIDSCPMWANRDSLMMQAFLELEPGTKATFAESQTGINGDYFINGYSAEIYNGKHVQWSPVLKDDPGYYIFWIWDSAAWDSTTIWA